MILSHSGSYRQRSRNTQEHLWFSDHLWSSWSKLKQKAEPIHVGDSCIQFWGSLSLSWAPKWDKLSWRRRGSRGIMGSGSKPVPTKKNVHLPSGKLAQLRKITILNRYIIYKWTIFHSKKLEMTGPSGCQKVWALRGYPPGPHSQVHGLALATLARPPPGFTSGAAQSAKTWSKISRSKSGDKPLAHWSSEVVQFPQITPPLEKYRDGWFEFQKKNLTALAGLQDDVGRKGVDDVAMHVLDLSNRKNW